ncbi:calaxin-like [Schistocerca serialis cubense]|uniref:calaxin-like n=1 Tax=Schistocerca serialis cubense TaxID=2023355 RepID=UPI00214E914D|nr:calaxin-like [Schistocerca serialis cubense]
MGDDAAAAAASSAKGAHLLVEHLRRRTHFSRQEIEALCRVYRSLVASTSAAGGSPAAAQASAVAVAAPPLAGVAAVEGLDRVVFRELLHNTFDLVTEEVLMDRVFCAFDRCNDGVVRLEEWVQGLSVFLRGTREQRTAFCFLVYDLNSDGYITRDEMFHLLRNCLVKHPNDEDPDEGVKDLVELALRKLDADRDGKVSFQDFQKAVQTEPLLLEAFGQCLPAESACHTFLATLREPQP